MAEALGIAAGIVQLLDLSSRVLLSSSRLYEKLKNVPGEIETVRRNTQQFIDLLHTISVAVYASNGPPPTSTTTQPACIILDAIAESRDLALLLESLSTPKSNAVKRAWAAVVSVKKQTEIAERSQRIESLKSSLQIWYQHHNQLRLEAQMARLANSQQLLTSVVRSLESQCNTKSISNRDSSSQIWRTELQGFPPALEQHRQRKPRSICHCQPTSNVTSVSFYPLQFFLSKRCHSPQCLGDEASSTSWGLGVRALVPRIQIIFNMALGVATFSLSARISPHHIVSQPESPAFRAVWKARQNIQYLLPGIFIGDSSYRPELEIGTSHSMFSSQGWIRYSRPSVTKCGGMFEIAIVCLQANPDFQEDIKKVFELLYERLAIAFESGKSSPRDQTKDGVTILHEVIVLGMSVLAMQEDLYFVLDKIIGLLINGGADPNASFNGISPLCLVFDRLSCIFYSPTALKQLRLDQILKKYNGTISEEFRLAKEPDAAGLFLHNQDLILDVGNSRILSAVARRSEDDLRILIRASAEDLETVTPHPLALAIGWPAGLAILLESGIKPSVAIEAAITQEDVQSVELLLDYGCPIFFQAQGDDEPYSLIEYAMDTGSPVSIISILTERIAGRRRALFKVASENLPEAYLQSILGKRESIGSLLDYRADMIFQQLQQIGMDGIQNLYPGTEVTIYHSHGMTHSTASTFYQTGFHDIDIPDETGRTPMTKRISDGLHRDGFRLMLWYLRQGADPCRKIPEGPNLLHFFSCFATDFLTLEVWDRDAWGGCNAIGVFGELYDFSCLRGTDECSCWCSSTGCTPVALVLKGCRIGTDASSTNNLMRRRRFLFHLPRYSSMRLQLTQQIYEDICRLEIFDRLGMAHTCGKYEEYAFFQYRSSDSEERHELQDEDSELKTILDAYLELYLGILDTYSGDFEIFWIAWLITLELFLPYQWDEHGSWRYPQIRIPGGYATVFCDPGDQNTFHQISSYGPEKEGIRSTMRRFILTLGGGVEEFLEQFVSNQHERGLLDRYMEHGVLVHPSPTWEV